MPRETEPEWTAGDPANNLETYWESWYKIGNADAVQVETYGRSEQQARTKADTTMSEELKKVAELGLSVDAECWTVKWQTRKQTRRWPKSNERKMVTRNAHGRVVVCAPEWAKGQGVL